ncbi:MULTISPECIES: hypothetical protein [unclassified Streptomyces]|uniref:hypothetical protein n=1 Tax=unclassified Streptomyces TaxID=2593676 RepID=UPI002258C769|nr:MULTISPECIES: hypothetical protein [unclassified Streptomyces]WSP59392.1 hypothetical protein OG306_37195 [Streptomyces sp. NBC_01241]WSU20090.1 hypothetical protein OG508_03180 [Streptomyces sp. NBC_01108]MCX4791155.1 hypothetical protein [Streptomyces sp. NBC_01221]MCX4793127.1 hypothetical protein [Streptomyces sp. NBC_01242]WSP61017.1 hypothetical protein OG466_03260 [Streptomyces sp. NBC_01240]
MFTHDRGERYGSLSVYGEPVGAGDVFASGHRYCPLPALTWVARLRLGHLITGAGA